MEIKQGERMKKNITALTLYELIEHITKTYTIPIPTYKQKDARPLIVESRSIWDRKRIKKRTRKPIKF